MTEQQQSLRLDMDDKEREGNRHGAHAVTAREEDGAEIEEEEEKEVTAAEKDNDEENLSDNNHEDDEKSSANNYDAMTEKVAKDKREEDTEKGTIASLDVKGDDGLDSAREVSSSSSSPLQQEEQTAEVESVVHGCDRKKESSRDPETLHIHPGAVAVVPTSSSSSTRIAVSASSATRTSKSVGAALEAEPHPTSRNDDGDHGVSTVLNEEKPSAMDSSMEEGAAAANVSAAATNCMILEATPVREIFATEVVPIHESTTPAYQQPRPLSSSSQQQQQQQQQVHPFELEHVQIDDHDDHDHEHKTTGLSNRPVVVRGSFPIPPPLSTKQIVTITVAVVAITIALSYLVFEVLVPRDDDFNDDGGDACQNIYRKQFQHLLVLKGMALLELIIGVMVVAQAKYYILECITGYYCFNTQENSHAMTEEQETEQKDMRWFPPPTLQIILSAFLLQTIWLLITISIVIYMSAHDLNLSGSNGGLLRPLFDESCLTDDPEDTLSLLGYYASCAIRISPLIFQSISYGRLVITQKHVCEGMERKWVRFWTLQKVVLEFLMLIWVMGTYWAILLPIINEYEEFEDQIIY